jgi:hypothetical protein
MRARARRESLWTHKFITLGFMGQQSVVLVNTTTMNSWSSVVVAAADPHGTAAPPPAISQQYSGRAAVDDDDAVVVPLQALCDNDTTGRSHNTIADDEDQSSGTIPWTEIWNGTYDVAIRPWLCRHL